MKKLGFVIYVLVFTQLIFSTWMSCFAQAEEKEIRIGVMGPLKFDSGIDMLAGAKLAVKDINDKGGILVRGVRYKINMITADTNEYVSVPDSISAMKRLITFNQVHFLIGGHRSEATLAQMEVMADEKKVFLNVQSASPELNEKLAKNYEKYKYWFRVGAINAVYIGKVGYASLDIIKEQLRVKCGVEHPKVALQFEKAVWADAIIEGAKEALPKMGLEIVRIGRHSATATDLSAELMAIKNSGAHIIFSGAAGPCATTLSKQWSELKIPAALHSASTPAQKKSHWAATGGGCEYESLCEAIGPVEITPLTLPWYKRFVKETGEFPTSGGSVSAYDGMHLLKTAIERAGTLDSDAVVRELEKIDRQMGVYGYWKFTPRNDKWPHDMVWAPGYITYAGTQWKDGRLQSFWPDGRATLGDKNWIGTKFKGTEDYLLPPWVITYYKNKK